MTDVLSEAIELLEMEKGRTEVEREEVLAASRDQAEDYETLDTLAGRAEGLEAAIAQLRTLTTRPDSDYDAVMRWLQDALSRNQIVHEIDREAARAFVRLWAGKRQSARA